MSYLSPFAYDFCIEGQEAFAVNLLQYGLGALIDICAGNLTCSRFFADNNFRVTATANNSMFYGIESVHPGILVIDDVSLDAFRLPDLIFVFICCSHVLDYIQQP